MPCVDAPLWYPQAVPRRVRGDPQRLQRTAGERRLALRDGVRDHARRRPRGAVPRLHDAVRSVTPSG